MGGQMKAFVLFLGTFLAAAAPAAAELAPEAIGDVEAFNRQDHDRLVWVTDMNSPYQAHSRGYLIDPDTGAFLAMLDLGYWTTGFELPAAGNRIVSPETHFSRTTRGTRTDVIVSYDAATFQPVAEIEIPPKRASVVKMQGTAALSDDDRFLAQMNFTPANSITIVDLAQNRFVGETDTPGCANVYGGGERAFHLLCGDGSFLTLTLAEDGTIAGKTRSQPLFDPFEDPISISGVRNCHLWYFVTLGGRLHEFSMTPDGVAPIASWSLISDDEAEDEWSISGFQHLALHTATNRLYLLTHQGPPETFEDPGTHVWVYDLTGREKTDELELEELSLSIAVSQDDDPLLYAVGAHIPMPFLAQLWVFATQGEAAFYDVMQLGLDIYKADSGTYLRTVPRLGNLPTYIQPW